VRGRALAAICGVALTAGCGGDDGGGGGREASAARPPAPEIVDRLRDGGNIVVFRHAATDQGADMTDDLRDCSRQRNLSAEGREESRAIGRGFERLEISVGRVLASPFCRTRHTARIAFGRVRTSRRLLAEEFFASPAEARRRGLESLLSSPPGRAANTVMVTHGSAIAAATGVNPDEGGAVVVVPRRRAPGFDVIGTTEPGAWAQAR
jgi:phosphohistidine phosphatase SixA